MEFVTRKNTGGRPERLTEYQKDIIINNYNHGDTQLELAKKYGVSRSTIQRLIRERRQDG